MDRHVEDMLRHFRACPFDCGWEARRTLPWRSGSPQEWRIADFVERCRADVVAHLVDVHDASRLWDDEEAA